MCLYPKLIKNKKYTITKKNNGIIPECTDERTLYVPVGCGKCIECMKQKCRAWQVRLYEEIKISPEKQYVTLTFSEESLEELEKITEFKDSKKILENEIATTAVRRFLERWRKKYGKSVKHWLCTELGHNGSERIHLHGIIFSNNIEDIKNIWGYGFIRIGEYVNEQTINYIVKYINKIDLEHKGYIPKILCSKGIGSNYLNKYDSKLNEYKGKDTKEYYRTKTGQKINLPIYYRNKIYNEKEREQLWINKLDEEVRYVCGEKIDVSKTESNYNNIVEHYRLKNKRLGYGDDSNEWSKEEYQRQRQMLKYIKNYNKSKEKEQLKREHNYICEVFKPNKDFNN